MKTADALLRQARQWDEAALAVSEVEILIQVLGKPKARMMMSVDADAKETERLALENPAIREVVGDKPVRKVIAVPGRLVNIVV